MINQTSQLKASQAGALAAMSGGVDSTVAAMLALREGYDCAGAAMLLHEYGRDDAADAAAAAEQLGIPFYTLDFTGQFSINVIGRFISAYREGKTPNPCVDCNRFIKFGCLPDKAREMGRQFLITGHYARIDRGADGRYLLKKGADASKDQSYVLYGLTQEQLACTVFPLGELSKSSVREIALDAGLLCAERKESQDICFVPGGDYPEFIREYTGEDQKRGRFVDTDGNYLGDNAGVIGYTIGQRRGLGLAMPQPVYVVGLRPEDGTVIVGKEGQLYSKTLQAHDINLIAAERLDSPVRARVKLRYKQSEQPAIVRQIDEDVLRIEFDEPQRAITGGQAAVIYDGDTVIGGGTICVTVHEPPRLYSAEA